MRWRYFTRLIIVQGQLALIDGDLSLAGELAYKALELTRSTKSGKNSARACLLRGQVLLAIDRIDQAESSIQEALSVAQQLHWLGMSLVCQLALRGGRADRLPAARSADPPARRTGDHRADRRSTDEPRAARAVARRCCGAQGVRPIAHAPTHRRARASESGLRIVSKRTAMRASGPSASRRSCSRPSSTRTVWMRHSLWISSLRTSR